MSTDDEHLASTTAPPAGVRALAAHVRGDHGWTIYISECEGLHHPERDAPGSTRERGSASLCVPAMPSTARTRTTAQRPDWILGNSFGLAGHVSGGRARAAVAAAAWSLGQAEFASELVYRLVVVHHRGVHDHDALAEGPEADGLSGSPDLRHLLAEGGLVLLLLLVEGDRGRHEGDDHRIGADPAQQPRGQQPADAVPAPGGGQPDTVHEHDLGAVGGKFFLQFPG